MVRAGNIIADRLRRMMPDEDGAGIADAADQPLGIGRLDLQVLGRECTDDRDGCIEVVHQDDGPMIGP